MKVEVEVDGKRFEIASGLINAEEVYGLVGCENRSLFVKRSNDTRVPLDSTDFLIVRGNETLVTDERATKDNTPLRNTVQLRFNGRAGPEIQKAKITGKELKAFDTECPGGRLFANIDTDFDAEIGDDMKILVPEGNAFFVIPAENGLGFGDPVDIESCSKYGRLPPKGQKYKIRIDRKKYTVEKAKITGEQILALADKTSEEWSLNQKLSGGKRERIKANEIIDVSRRGIERFESVRRQAQQGHE